MTNRPAIRSGSHRISTGCCAGLGRRSNSPCSRSWPAPSSAYSAPSAAASGRAGCPRLIAAYVELIRNTPLLIQLYFVFFSLPLIGLKFSSDTAAIVALSIHFGAYATGDPVAPASNSNT